MYDSIIIVGATATGKTKIGIELAKLLKTEVINADSMYIFKDLNIGTAKPLEPEMDGIKHHLIDIVEPIDTFNVAEYRTHAKDILKIFSAEKKIPIIVGGTGFYIDSLISNYSYGDAEKNDELRANLYNEYEKFGSDYIHNKLKELDYESYLKIEKNDIKRIIRAIEICLISGSKKSLIKNNEEPLLKNPLIIGLNLDRAILYDRINQRVDKMLEMGLIQEVKNLYNSGLNPESNQSMKGIGYKEIIEYLRGNYTLEEAIEKIKQHTRNYAKRQITWFKRNQQIIWMNPLSKDIISKILDIYKKDIA